MPVSEISTKIKLASFRVLTRISPPFGVNFEALFSKFHRTCWSRAVSPTTICSGASSATKSL